MIYSTATNAASRYWRLLIPGVYTGWGSPSFTQSEGSSEKRSLSLRAGTCKVRKFRRRLRSIG
jgi:hypothetical protein